MKNSCASSRCLGKASNTRIFPSRLGLDTPPSPLGLVAKAPLGAPVEKVPLGAPAEKVRLGKTPPPFMLLARGRWLAGVPARS